MKMGKLLDRLLTSAGADLFYLEPEGMAIHIPDKSKPKEARLCFGYASTAAAASTPKLASLFCKDTMI